MTKQIMGRPLTLVAALVAAVLVACGGKVDQETYNEDIAELRSTVEEQSSQIDENTARIDEVESRLDALENDLQQMEEDFQANISRLEKGIRFAVPVHFDFDKAQIRPVDRPILDRFASVAKKHYKGATITVEGFADPAGSDAYNDQLSTKRAQAVVKYLTEKAGMNKKMLRTAGYGEADNRLVKPGAQGPGREGLENRRVTFVIEYAGGLEG